MAFSRSHSGTIVRSEASWGSAARWDLPRSSPRGRVSAVRIEGGRGNWVGARAGKSKPWPQFFGVLFEFYFGYTG